LGWQRSCPPAHLGRNRLPASGSVHLRFAYRPWEKWLSLVRWHRNAKPSHYGIVRLSCDLDCFPNRETAPRRLRYSSTASIRTEILGRLPLGVRDAFRYPPYSLALGPLSHGLGSAFGKRSLQVGSRLGRYISCRVVDRRICFSWLLALFLLEAFTFLASRAISFSRVRCRSHPQSWRKRAGVLQVVETGLLFCFTIRRTGNLWFAVGFHAAWDWAETFFYGTPDSGLLGVGRLLNTVSLGPKWLTGGSAGPEGSVVAFVLLLLCAFLIHLRFPNTIYPDRPR
jgi:hypothetical protein